MTKNKISTADIVLMALFATLTVIATSFIRIPLPAAIGAPFIHFGNTVVLLSILLLGFKKGSLAGGVGFAIFDILNGFAPEAPYFLVESFVVGAAATLALTVFKKNPTKIYQVTFVAVMASLAKIIMSYAKLVVTLMIAGSSFQPALVAAATSMPATLINTVSTIIATSLLYFPLKKIMGKYYLRTQARI